MNDFPVPAGFWDLPTCPQVAHQILKLVPLDRQTIGALLDVIRWDPAISARVLSAGYRFMSEGKEPEISLESAGGSLEDVAFCSLCLQFNFDSLSPGKQADARLYQSYWRHARFRAAACRLLCELQNLPAKVNPHLLGLLGNLPRLALIQAYPREVERIDQDVLQSGEPWSQIEKNILSVELQTIAAKQLSLDVFPDPISEILQPERKVTAPPDEAIGRLRAVLDVAEALADFLEFEHQDPSPSPIRRKRLQRQFEEVFNSAEIDLEDVIASVRQIASEPFPENEAPLSAAEMYYRANRELGRLGRGASRALQKNRRRAEQAERSVRRHEQTIAQLKHEALLDSLTGVFNRWFFLESLRKEAARCCRSKTPIGLLFLDVDEFKALNDTWGHLVGDRVLRQVAETLRNELREADVLARYGGEEFVILPSGPSERGIVQLAERLRLAVEQLAISLEGGRVPVTISVGSSLTRPKQDDEALGPQLLAAADAAMYDAKRLGRNCSVFRPLENESDRELMQQAIDRSFSRWLIQQNILSEQALEGLLMDYTPRRQAIGELAVEMGLLTDEQAADLIDPETAGGDNPGDLALRRNWITPEQLALLLARQRENPMQLARLLIRNNLLEESQAERLVDEYLASAMS